VRCGNEPATGTYYEVLGEGGGGAAVLMIHGGGATGACFRADLDGNPGWADLLAARGHEVWVTDWPGCGRSGNRNVIDIEYADVVAGYRRLLRDVIGKPVVVIPHSMGGATTWQLIEHETDLVAGVVAVAASFPGNIRSRSTVLGEDGTVIRVRFEDSGAEFTVDRGRGYLYEDDYIYRQAIGGSTRFPLDRVGDMRAGLVPFPPRMLLQRMGVLPGLPPVEDTSGFEGMRIRLVAGTEDPAHTHEIERSTVDLLASWGAEVELVWLGDRGIVGNGHFMMFEENSRDVLEVIGEQVNAVAPQAGHT
jgi:pimeloyl-ACP methyl ester carboxylesterase